MKIREFLKIIDTYAPFDNAYAEDNIGLIIGNENSEIEKVYIALDVNLQIAKKAVENKCKTIIVHHPLFFNKIQKITNTNYDLIQYLMQNNLNVIALHTNIDFKNSIISKLIFKKTGLKALEVSNDIEGCAIYELNKEISSRKLFEILKIKLDLEYIRFNNHKEELKKIAVIGGAGMYALEELKKYEIDCFLTGDVKFNYFTETNNMLIADIGHEAEVVFVDLIKRICTNYHIDCSTDYEKFVKIF